MVRLRRHIEEIASRESYMGEQMPIKWLKFEQAVTKLTEDGTRFTSLDQVWRQSEDRNTEIIKVVLRSEKNKCDCGKFLNSA